MAEVRITRHALHYTRHGEKSRTMLLPDDIKTIVWSESYVELGNAQKTDFCLTWDWYNESGIILLMKRKFCVISIWKSDFGVPRGVSVPGAGEHAVARDKVAMIAVTA